MPDALPDPASVGHLLLSVPVIAVVLYFAWRMQREQRGVSDRQNELIDRWWARHEDAEEHQRKTVEKLADNIHANTAALTDLAASIRTQSPTFTTLANEVHEMTALHDRPATSDQDIHPGVPGGVPVPIPIDEADLQAMDLMSENRPWTHRAHGIDALHTAGHRGDPRVLIVVLDTGIDGGHPDLRHVLHSAGRSFTGEPMHDGNGHGTHCTGTVTGLNDAARRVMGVAHQCAVIHYKVLTNQGSGGSGGIASAIRAVADLQGYAVKIISGSFGSKGEDAQITQAVRYAHAKGVVQVYAAGNSGPNSPNWPGMLPECIAVGASAPDGSVAPFSSSHGDYVDVTAGGVNVPSCYPGGRLAVMSGTSMATPLVAGVIGVACGYALKTVGLAPTDAEVKEALYATCVPHTPAGRDSRGGYGRVRGPEFADALAKLVARRKSGEPKPEPKPDQAVRIAVPEGAKFVVLSFQA